MNPPKKEHFLDRAIAVYKFHVQSRKDDPDWNICKCASALNRSIGSVSQDILLARWSLTHEKQLRRFRSMSDALEWVRDKQKEISFKEID